MYPKSLCVKCWCLKNTNIHPISRIHFHEIWLDVLSNVSGDSYFPTLSIFVDKDLIQNTTELSRADNNSKWVRAAQANDKCRNIETMETLSTWWVPQFPQNGDRETLLRKNLSWKWNCSGRSGFQPSMVCGAQNTNVLATDPPQPKQLQLICKLLRCCSVPHKHFFFYNISFNFNMWWSCHGMDVLQWTVCGLKTLCVLL